MSGRQTIKQRIAFEGGEAMKAQLQALGETGEKAFKKITSASTQANFAKLGASLNKVGADLATVGKRLALGYAAISTAASAAAASVVLLARNSAHVVTDAGKAAQSAGLQIDAYGRLAFAAEAAYISQDDLRAGLNRLNKELGAALSGNKASVDKFKMLGIAIRDANGKIRPTEAIVRDLARAFARMPDSAKKSALAMQFFGKSGASLIPFLNQGAEGLKELGDKAERLGIVFSPDQLKIGDALRTALDDAGVAIKAVRVQLGLLFAPGVTRGANALRDMIVQNRKAMLDFVNRAVEPATQIIKDFVLALTGRDAEVKNVWIVEWRDGIIQFGKDAYAVVNGVVLPAFETVRKTASGVTDVINSLFGTNLTGGQLLLTTTLLQLIGGFKLLKSSVMLAVEAIALLSRAFWANPWTAVLAGVAAGIGLWATRTDSATTAMETHRSAVDTVAEAYRKAGGEVAKMAKEERDRELNKQIASVKELDAALETAIGKWQQALRSKLVFTAKDSPFRQIMEDAVKGVVPVKEFIAEVNRIGGLSPDFAEGAVGLTALSEGAEEVGTKSRVAHDWIALLRGEATDAAFQATKTGESFRGLGANAAGMGGDITSAGAAAADTKAKVEDLGNAITVTKYGASGPVKQTFELVDGVARAVDKSKASLDELSDGSEQAEQKIKGVTDRMASAIRSVPEQFRGQTTPAEALTAGLDEAGAKVEQTATSIATVTATARQGVDALGESWVETNKQAAAALSELPNTAKTAVDALAAEVSRIPAIMTEVQGTQAVADAMLEPFQKLAAAVDGIMAGIRSAAQNGFGSLIGIVRELAGEIETMISRIIAALRQAAAEAAKLRASGSSSSSSRPKGRGFAGGGDVRGAGTGTSDSILAWLSNGEFVARAKSVAYYGPGLFHALNNLQLPKDFLKGIRGFNLGGLAEGIRSRLSSFNIPQFAGGGLAMGSLMPVAASGRPVVLQLPGGQMIPGFTGTDDAIEQVRRHAASKAMTSAGRKPRWYK